MPKFENLHPGAKVLSLGCTLKSQQFLKLLMLASHPYISDLTDLGVTWV